MMRSRAGFSLRSFSASSANAKISSISALVRSAMEIKLRMLPVRLFIPWENVSALPARDGDLVNSVGFPQHHIDAMAFPCFDVFADDIGSGGELPRAPVDHQSDENFFLLGEID